MFRTLVCSLVLVGSTAARAQQASNAPYGVVDMQTIILTVDEGKAARSQLEKEIKTKEAELTKEKDALDKLNKDWKTQSPLLSEDARLKKQQEFQERFMNLRNQEMNFQAEIKRKEQAATQKIAVKVSEIVQTIAKQKGFHMVFETSSAGLLYLKDPVDLTKDVIQAYEAQTKSAGGKKSKSESK